MLYSQIQGAEQGEAVGAGRRLNFVLLPFLIALARMGDSLSLPGSQRTVSCATLNTFADPTRALQSSRKAPARRAGLCYLSRHFKNLGE